MLGSAKCQKHFVLLNNAGVYALLCVHAAVNIAGVDGMLAKIHTNKLCTAAAEIEILKLLKNAQKIVRFCCCLGTFFLPKTGGVKWV